MKKVGIWGFGAVGKSALEFFSQQPCTIEVLDNRELSLEEQALLTRYSISCYPQTELMSFLERNDCIMPSPGIDLRPFSHFRHKWICELDLFTQHFNNPIIAITGSLGKTSVTHLLSNLLKNAKKNIATGGNIGTPMLSLLNRKNSDCALLEISSFQLEQCLRFSPDLAIITNIHPNHLDRHSNMAEYIDAKYRMLLYQREHQTALIPFALLPEIKLRGLPKSALGFFSLEKPSDNQIAQLPKSTNFFYCLHNQIIVETAGNMIPIISCDKLPPISFLENWLIIAASLHILGISLEEILLTADNLALPDHRLQKIATVNQVDFYNDSKSTTPLSMLAAFNALNTKPVHLFLGGTSKGIDRTSAIEQIANRVYQVYCFGKEATQLQAACRKFNISASAFNTLEEAFNHCTKLVRNGDVALFSPSGASYDLFENYEKRGKRFKELVENYAISAGNDGASIQQSIRII